MQRKFFIDVTNLQRGEVKGETLLQFVDGPLNCPRVGQRTMIYLQVDNVRAVSATCLQRSLYQIAAAGLDPRSDVLAAHMQHMPQFS
ncbi:hypothetical protein CDAR_112461 [Caerostris darwini]|uniref:Uncharacterized protein n=1 Tax=Caerostris darwini TaxID=1538125 RepID=A0AAV4Q239_9ARAC|nr:hypothetical protein CDAR_112461 [Caerostris darwini]